MTKISNEDGDLFKMEATAKKSEKIWVRDMAKVKINKRAVCDTCRLQTCRLADLQTCRLADLQTCRLADPETGLGVLQTC